MLVKVVHLAFQRRTFWATCTSTWSITIRGQAKHTAKMAS